VKGGEVGVVVGCGCSNGGVQGAKGLGRAGAVGAGEGLKTVMPLAGGAHGAHFHRGTCDAFQRGIGGVAPFEACSCCKGVVCQ
jgi:hypothetical protein